MSIKVDFYKNFSKRTNSTKQPSVSDAKDSFDCTLKENCSITSPEIEVFISGDPADKGYNYAYIPSFKRYYFVSEWRAYRGLWIASLNVDVLGSFKTQIGAQTKYVTRSASLQSYNIADGLYPVMTEAKQTNTTLTGEFNLAGGFYILGLLGAQQSGVPAIGGINYYYLSPSQMLNFTNYLTSSAFNNLMNNTSEGVTAALSKMAVNPIEYVASCMYFPCSITLPVSPTYVQPKIGWWDTYPLVNTDESVALGGQISNLIGYPTNMNATSFTLPTHPQAARGNYMNRAPYSQYIFHLDPFGDVEIPSELMFDFDNLTQRTCKYTVALDLISGLGRLHITNNDATEILAEEYTQIGVPIQLSQINTDIVGLIAGAGKDIWDKYKGIFNDTISQAGSMILNGIEAMHTRAHETGQGGGSIVPFEANKIIKGPVLRTINLTVANEYNTEFGRPYYGSVTISSLGGFVKCADGEHDVAALDQEKTMISDFMTGGFFYE